MKHHLGKGDNFVINEDGGPQWARGAGPSRGKTDSFLEQSHH